MAERTDWKGLHAEAVAAHEQTKKVLEDALNSALALGKENDQLRDDVEGLRKQVNIARIQGMNEVTSLLLREVG